MQKRDSVLIQRTKIIVELNYGHSVAHVGNSVALAQGAKLKTRTKIGAPVFAQHTVLGYLIPESTMKDGPLPFPSPSLFRSLSLVPPLRHCCQVSSICLGFLVAALT